MSYRKSGKCSINPKHRYENWGNNAEPVNEGRCCDYCNDTVVIPARLMGREMHEMMKSTKTLVKSLKKPK